ncbi:pyruvate dehydrogenase complex dihydrolipoamide acetyltransferase [Yaniella flava]|uniref:Dihydrolipoamide acetyltransferase component of pyruvate dehydrogenase complex n=1 Tax=Yaniella flava TaxID=287930 RepID=A0ABN2UVI6_9MICC|nr:2-oxo acid dehydrogenase subunit E2 [Micrococcaceae bacterium]
MAHLITMPAVVADAEDAVVASWLVSVGNAIKQGQPIAEVETEKATVEMESTGTGTLSRIVAETGAVVAVGAPIAGLLEPGEDESAIDQLMAEADVGHGTSEVAREPAAQPQASQASPTPEQAGADTSDSSTRRVFASPIARKKAKEAGIAFEHLTGSGPNGRIIRADVEAAIANQAPVEQPQMQATVQLDVSTEQKYRAEKASPMRKAIARRLTESKTTVPHFYLAVDIAMDQLLQTRSKVNDQLEETGLRLTVNDLLVKALSTALLEVTEANATWHEDTIRYYETVDIAVAVATDGGLITPVVEGVDQRSLSSITAAMNDIKERSAAGKIRQDELEGGTFTLSNLGMFGTREFSAIINPPHAGIIATGATEERVVAVDGKPEVARMMTATLSADHRVVDGAVGARLMQSFKRVIENPLRLLV